MISSRYEPLDGFDHAVHGGMMDVTPSVLVQVVHDGAFLGKLVVLLVKTI